MADIQEWLRRAVESGTSDIFIGAGRPVLFKQEGVTTPQGAETVNQEEAAKLVSSLYEMAGRPMDRYLETGDDDFPVSVPKLARFRVSAYRQRGTMAAIIRVVLFGIPDYKQFMLPENIITGISQKSRGLVLVTGPAGSGKSTTLACAIDYINKTRSCHIITLEDPIEFLHRDNKSIVSQREIATDTVSYITALRACLRQAPDIILLGEMRDHETIGAAMTAAETGHLVISTLHTVGAVNTIDRIIDVFPPAQQQQVKVQLSMLLQTVISQRLIPSKEDGLLPVFEVMHLNSAIRNMIRESKIHQIDSVLQTSSQEGMISMDASIYHLYQNGVISADTALDYAVNPDQLARKLGK